MRERERERERGREREREKERERKLFLSWQVNFSPGAEGRKILSL